MIKYVLQIKEFHLDTFGHVNNATYLELYEEARWEMITSKGYGLKKIQESRQGPVILECTVRFMKEIQLRENIQILTEPLDYKGKIGTLKQWILKEDGSTASEAKFKIGLFDLDQRRLIAPTPEWEAAVQMPRK